MLPKRVDCREVAPVEIEGGKRQVQVLIDGARLPNAPVALARYTYQPLVKGPRHCHQTETEIYYCLNGSGTVTVEEEVFVMEPGVVVYIPPGKEHQTASGSRGLDFIAIFSPPLQF